jgi:hypothetical protein
MGRTEASDKMQVVFDAAYVYIGKTEVAGGTGHVGVKVRTRCLIEEGSSIPRRKDDVNINQ